MRYAIVSKGLTVSQLQDEVQRSGGRNLKVASASGQIFCDLDVAGVTKLREVSGLSIKEVRREVKPPEAQQQIVATPPVTPPSYADVPIYAASSASIVPGFFDFRELLSPPITGSLSTICILDSGVRKTHQGLNGKVVYEANFSSSPTVEDVFDHGTGVAFCAAGGRHSLNEESGGAPGAYLWNIKVLSDDGGATDEECVLALEHCIEKRKEAEAKGLSYEDPMFPNMINMSWGAPDDGDPDNPIRLACRAASEAGFCLMAAAGNYGPNPETVTLPATDELVGAVGAATFYPTDVWQYSSRGPTKEGLVKPDYVFFGVRILTASCKADDAFVIKSGTSFACPFLVGMWSCGQEAFWRLYGERMTAMMTAEEVWGMIHELGTTALAQMPITGVSLAAKPAGAPTEKDNDYGWGLPMGSLWSQAFVPAMDIGSIVAGIAPIVAIGMLGMMMAPMAKALR